MRALQRLAILALVVVVCGCVCSAQVEVPKAAKEISAKYYKIGGKVKPPKPVDTPEPSTNKTELEKSKKGKTVGTVLLWIGIGVDGSVEAAYVVRSVSAKLDEKALEAVRQWKFQPTTRDGVPVPVQTNVEVNFLLH